MTDETKKKITKWFWIILTAPFAVIFLLLLLVWMFARIPSFEELEHPDNKLATQLIADDGTTVLSTFHIENRTYVPYEELSPHLIHAAVSTEDVRAAVTHAFTKASEADENVKTAGKNKTACSFFTAGVIVAVKNDRIIDLVCGVRSDLDTLPRVVPGTHTVSHFLCADNNVTVIRLRNTGDNDRPVADGDRADP